MVALGPYLRQGTLNQSVQPTLAGDGLVLRPWREEDAAVVVAAYSEPDIGLFNRRTMDSEAEALEWVRAWSLRWQKETGANWAVCRSGQDVVVGRAALSRINLAEGDGELGYWVLSSERRQGFAARAVEALKAWAFATVGLQRLQLSHSVHNRPSPSGRQNRFCAGRNTTQEPEARRRMARHAPACGYPGPRFEFYLSVKARRASVQ